MARYLYGASVQGIQDFIFKTNGLKEIVGASEIVKNIATIFTNNYNPDEILINAAGNIKVIFDSEAECQKAVLNFPKIVMQSAFGITISQAVIKIEDNHTQDDIDELEQNLKTQRNKPNIPLDSSINIMKLAPKTAKPVSKHIKSKDKEIPIDEATNQKLESFPQNSKYNNLSDISNSKNKIAVIHIDGNGLGNIVQKIGNKLSSFSSKLDKATKKAFEIAKRDKKIREIILGGDDVTVICDANDALSFTKEFLENFEIETKSINELNGIADKITACAGIAYCNEKYPFHYAVSLAETLCGVAKNDSDRKSSCLMFHNIQSSNFQSWDKIIKDELTIKNDTKTLQCYFGAYYLNKENKPLIKDFITITESLRLKDSPSSRLRSWLSELYKSDTNAKNFLNRIDIMADEKLKFKIKLNENFKTLHPKLQLNNQIIDDKVPVYDMLQILSTTSSYKGDKNDS